MPIIPCTHAISLIPRCHEAVFAHPEWFVILMSDYRPLLTTPRAWQGIRDGMHLA